MEVIRRFRRGGMEHLREVRSQLEYGASMSMTISKRARGISRRLSPRGLLWARLPPPIER